jgi:hypothetical protein
MKSWLVALLAMVTSLGLAGSATAAESDTLACKVGRPAYCQKYHGVCQQQGGPACDAWALACFECHAASATCTSSIRIKAQYPECDRCQASWSACMAATYVAHWPAKAE